jgi:hypothetical protein
MDDAHRHYEWFLVGSPWKADTEFPAASPWDVACRVWLSESGYPGEADDRVLVVSEMHREEYRPPRARKARERWVPREIGRWTLGEFRRRGEVYWKEAAQRFDKEGFFRLKR